MIDSWTVHLIKERMKEALLEQMLKNQSIF